MAKLGWITIFDFAGKLENDDIEKSTEEWHGLHTKVFTPAEHEPPMLNSHGLGFTI